MWLNFDSLMKQEGLAAFSDEVVTRLRMISADKAEKLRSKLL